jgi:hypothetical protein
MTTGQYLFNHGNNRKYKKVIASLTTSQIAQHSGYCASRSRRADIGGYGFRTDLLRFRRRHGWIGLLELALLLLFLLSFFFQVSFPLFELIVWFWQFVILFLV